MSFAVIESDTNGDNRARLQSMSENNQATLKWLVIAHSDPLMTHRLSEVVSDQSAVMLSIPQFHWDFDADALRETLEWSLSDAGVKHLLLVGHSQGAPPRDWATRDWATAGNP